MDLPNKSQPPPPEIPKKNIQPVIDGGAVKVPKTATKRFFNFVFTGSPKDMFKSVGVNVLLPQGKAVVEAAITTFIHGLLWENGQAPMSNIVKGSVLRGSAQMYHNAQNQPSSLQMVQQQAASRSAGHYEDVVFPTLQNAEAVLAQLYSVMNEYRVVAVADLYEMARIDTSPADNAFGWMSMDGARIIKVREGFLLELPRPIRIN